eukprot:GHVU01108953.1.p1 GENE.GHVU01108953.1~~GHVU01108953.1.p1  ORF type:complete len:117 (-),score=17.36 GHVU01108953.1:36-386(-)
MTQLSVIGTPMNLSRYIQATGKFQLMYSEEKMVYLLEWKPEAATDNFVIVTMGNYIDEGTQGFAILEDLRSLKEHPIGLQKLVVSHSGSHSVVSVLEGSMATQSRRARQAASHTVV